MREQQDHAASPDLAGQNPDDIGRLAVFAFLIACEAGLAVDEHWRTIRLGLNYQLLKILAESGLKLRRPSRRERRNAGLSRLITHQPELPAVQCVR